MQVVLEVAYPAEILNRYFPNGKLGGLTIDGPVPSALGQHIELLVRVKSPSREFNVQGQLSWARHKGSRNLKECYGIDFLPGNDSSERLLAFARQDLDPEAMRGQPRLSTELAVRITHNGFVRREFLADLSSGGAFVRSGNPLEVGEEAVLQIRPPGSLTSMQLHSRVTWVRSTGAAPGMGLMFLDGDPKLRERLEKLLSRLSRS